jgi:hypothetical protein
MKRNNPYRFTTQIDAKRERRLLLFLVVKSWTRRKFLEAAVDRFCGKGGK